MYIIGLKPDENRIEEMTRELLANFWLAIYEGDLIVKINNKQFDSKSIYEEITLRYSELDESGQYNKTPNPRPYIETFIGIQSCTFTLLRKSLLWTFCYTRGSSC